MCADCAEGFKESTVQVAACNMSGLKIKLVDKVPAGKAGIRFCRVFFFNAKWHRSVSDPSGDLLTELFPEKLGMVSS